MLMIEHAYFIFLEVAEEQFLINIETESELVFGVRFVVVVHDNHSRPMIRVGSNCAGGGSVCSRSRVTLRSVYRQTAAAATGGRLFLPASLSGYRIGRGNRTATAGAASGDGVSGATILGRTLRILLQI